MSGKCVQCQGTTEDGIRCERLASCKQGCWNFCWQHAKMYKEGRAVGETWEKGKGCTGKKLYQYSKKPGPKTGACSSKTMVGASGRCVKRTPANLARKKEAMAKRKLEGKKKPAKKPAKKKPRIPYPFERNGGSYDDEEAISKLMGIFSCPEGAEWDDDMGTCVCGEGHVFDSELKKCVKKRDFERIGFPEAESLEDVFEEMGSPQGDSSWKEPWREFVREQAQKSVSQKPICLEGEIWSDEEEMCIDDPDYWEF